jgi:hypothetical protein
MILPEVDDLPEASTYDSNTNMFLEVLPTCKPRHERFDRDEESRPGHHSKENHREDDTND